MATPQVPPRPARTQHQAASTGTTLEAPPIPPRPSNNRSDRSQSPHRDSFARSPLNEIPFTMYHNNISGTLHDGDANASSSNVHLPQRSPSVNLPSIGQEGEEYAGIADENTENVDVAPGTSPTQTRNVSSDLPLYAPKPSLSSSDAKARISTVTRTDSSQAVAAGIGKPGNLTHADDKDVHFRPLRAKESFTRTESSASTERPSSAAADGEQGIPEIGQRVPMYPNAGDVQAPSPSPYTQSHPTGIGFHNDGTQRSRHHGRTRSGRESFQGPPGSYGLHGHGIVNVDKFEKAWYDKHPDVLQKEESGQYGPGIGGVRGEWALSSDDLNKIVRETASRGSGFGTSPNIVGMPNEQIGYIASEEYASRISTPRLPTSSYHKKAHSNHSQSHVESPLRKASFPVDVSGADELLNGKGVYHGQRRFSEQALESETEDEDVIHVDPPEIRTSKFTGNGYDPPTEDLGPHGGNTESQGGWIEERGYGVPILASDEVAKEPGFEYLQPAISPAQEQRGSAYYAGIDSEVTLSYQSGYRHGSLSGSANSSRPTSRPGSIHGTLPNLSRFTSHDEREDMHTPLENVEEYEPLFPDEESKQKKPLGQTERFRHRPEAKRRFPSQDIWEDTPNSLQLQAEVTTPEPSGVQSPSAVEKPAAVFETPEMEAARKGEATEDDKAQLLSREERLARSNFKPHLRDDLQRPGMKQRFPSRDIWEDTPDHSRLETTVGESNNESIKSPVDAGLEAGAVVITAGRPNDGKPIGDQAREGATAGAPAVEKPSVPPRPLRSTRSEEQPQPPSIPARPQHRARQVPLASQPSPLSRESTESSPTETKPASPTEARKVPAMPDRPKPQVPARPAKSVSRDSSEGVPLAKTDSATSTGSTGETSASKGFPPVPKPKPVIPARPPGNKIASLKAGFLSDLDKRLQIGPQAPPKAQDKAVEDEKEEDKEPLTDARKGRARGPARRKPAASPSATDDAKPMIPELTFTKPWSVWDSSPNGHGISVGGHDIESAGTEDGESVSKSKESAIPPQATNSTSNSIESSEAPESSTDPVIPSATASERPPITETPLSSAKDSAASTNTLHTPAADDKSTGPTTPSVSTGVLVSHSGNAPPSAKEEAPKAASTEMPVANKKDMMSGADSDMATSMATEGGLVAQGGNAIEKDLEA